MLFKLSFLVRRLTKEEVFSLSFWFVWLLEQRVSANKRSNCSVWLPCRPVLHRAVHDCRSSRLWDWRSRVHSGKSSYSRCAIFVNKDYQLKCSKVTLHSHCSSPDPAKYRSRIHSPPLGTTSTIRSLPGLGWIWQNYLVSDERSVHLLGGVQGSPAPFERQFWVRERAKTAVPEFKREPTSLVRSSRESWNHYSRVRERADIPGPEFEREPKPLFQGSRECLPRGRCVRHQKQFWYIEPARVSLYLTNSYPWILLVRYPEVQWAVKSLEWMGILLV
jgi:hypothetical protein